MAVRSFTVWTTREAPSYREYIGCLSQGVEGEWNGLRGQKGQTHSYKKNKSRGWEPGITSHRSVRGRKGPRRHFWEAPAAGSQRDATGAQGNLRPWLEKPLRRRRRGARPPGWAQQRQVLSAASSLPLTKQHPPPRGANVRAIAFN